VVAFAITSWRSLYLVLNRLPRFAEHALIYGDGPLAVPLMDEISRRPELGLRISGYVGSDPQIAGVALVSADDIAGFVARTSTRRIIVTMGERRGHLNVGGLLELKASGLRIEDAPEYYETLTGKIPLDFLNLRWLLFSPGFQVRPVLRLYKRLSSLVFGSIGFVLASPLMALVALAIRIDSEGSAISRHNCMGEFGTPFTLYKFRTTYHNAQEVPAPLDDTSAAFQSSIKASARHAGLRITSVGKWLRRTRLDDLPLFFNIIKGDMSFVGPRPIPPHEREQCAAAIPLYMQRELIKPGATGWAQIHRSYDAALEDSKEELAYDLFYIKTLSLGLDVYILLATLKILLLGRGGAHTSVPQPSSL
jgi:lipopolysaccharide/colanic/teichoic acid biosynthesis glycosyltransferase